MAVMASKYCHSHAKLCAAVSTGNHNTSERGRLGHEHVLFLKARRNKKDYELCDMSSIKGEKDKGVQDDNDNNVEIIKALGSATKLLR